MEAVSFLRIVRVYSGSLKGLASLVIALLMDALRAVFNRLYPPLAEVCRATLRRMFSNSLVYTRDGLWFVVPSYREAFIAEIYLHEPISYKILSRIIERLGGLRMRVLFIDVGAHIGMYTIRFARKGIDVVAIEPNPLTLAYLRVNLTLNRMSRVEIIPFAAYSRHGLVKIQQAPELGWYRVSSEDSKSIITVRAFPLDEIYIRYVENMIT